MPWTRRRTRAPGGARCPSASRPDEWVEELDAAGYDSSRAADDGAEQREARWLLERGGGLTG